MFDHESTTTRWAPVSVERKLPQITALFYILKILAVTLGETAGDELGITLGIGYLATALVLVFVFAAVLIAQLRAARFRPALFWAVVLSTSAVGTEFSDGMDRGFVDGSGGIGYGWGALILTALLGLVFLVWWRTGQTYDVENISSRQGETLYWIAILVSNTLGTASGDWLADDTGLGFLAAFTIIAVILLVLLAAHYTTAWPTALLFWPAFVLTRPLGAAGGDFLTKPVDAGGLGWGTLGASVTIVVLLVAGVVHQTRRVRAAPLPTLPAPVHRVSGEAQTPNGALVPVAPGTG